MLPLKTISEYEAIKMLSDTRRLAVLRALMARPATLTHLGKIFDVHPAKARYHVKQLESAGLVTLTHTQKVGHYTEKFYQATAAAFTIQVAILPERGTRPSLLVSGSDDLALNLLADLLREDGDGPAMFTLPVGSLDGLIALRQGICQLAGCHLLDLPSGEYNTPYVRHLFPGQAMRVVTLTRRQQGLLVASGNPLELEGVEDLVAPEVRFINRQRGSGTRLWLDAQLKALEIPPQVILGYEQVADTHLGVADAVASGQADAGVAVLAAARARGLDFIPLFDERYDLVFSGDDADSALLAPVFDVITSSSFRTAVGGLAGYETQAAGEEIIL
ncbi:MAG: helix-turn-helix domain-containing protein [Anaerolineales bacterium]|nr:helix-turn-helix domain-containing protein [Anaerolineales bacterium]